MGELIKDDINMAVKKEITQEKFYVEFSECKNVMVYVGNHCSVELIRDKDSPGKIIATGDRVFLQCIDAEIVEYPDLEGYTLDLNIKNPSGSWSKFEDYDRCGYEGENYIQVFVTEDINIFTCNYLKLKATARTNDQGNHEEVFVKK